MSDLFERLLAEGETGIRRLVDERTQENVALEFKRKERPELADISKEDKRNLGKALSGMANAQGGVIIWGVKATREKDDPVDCARECQPIAGIERFEADIRNLAGELLTPKHDGIEVLRVNSENDDGVGYLLVRVTRSERRPHRSEAPNDGRYYRRAGSSTFTMEHGDLEDAFSRRAAPIVGLVYELTGPTQVLGSGPGEQVGVSLRLGVKNHSETLARFPYINVKVRPRSAGEMAAGLREYVPGFPLIERDSHDGWRRFVGRGDDVIPPDEVLWATRLVAIYQWDRTRRLLTRANRVLHDTFFGFDYRVGCEGGRSQTGSVIRNLADVDLTGTGYAPSSA